MPIDAVDSTFAGSIPQLYERYLVPLIFEPYARDLSVLAPGGRFLFNVWDRIEENEFANVVTAALADAFPAAPPRFLARTPHGYHDVREIAADLAGAGFAARPLIATLAERSRAPDPEVPAIAYCQGTPLRTEIEAAKAPNLAEATALAARAIASRFGRGAVDGRIQAHVVTVERPMS